MATLRALSFADPSRASRAIRITLLVGALLWARSAVAQELAPRTYWPIPKGVRVLVFGYAYSEGDVLFDPSIPLYGVDSATIRSTDRSER